MIDRPPTDPRPADAGRGDWADQAAAELLADALGAPASHRAALVAVILADPGRRALARRFAELRQQVRAAVAGAAVTAAAGPDGPR